MKLRRAYADTALGQMHYAECGTGEAVLCLHQTPRSLDEYREVLPLLGERYRAIAMDTPGMGQSDPPPRGASIDVYARAALALLDTLGIERAAVVGHHTGGVIALRLAALAGERIRALVLSSTAYVDADARALRAQRPPIDAFEVSADGSHLKALWAKRAAFYPVDRPDSLSRYVTDALRARDAEEGHLAVAAYAMEVDIGAVVQPTLLIAHRRDPYAFPEADGLRQQLPHAEYAVLDDGMVPLEFAADAFAAAVLPFLDAQSSAARSV